jgi:hypothetical protein
MNLSELYLNKRPITISPESHGTIPLFFNVNSSIPKPENPAIGTVSYDTDSVRAYVFNGSEWIQVGLVTPWQI